MMVAPVIVGLLLEDEPELDAEEYMAYEPDISADIDIAVRAKGFDLKSDSKTVSVYTNAVDISNVLCKIRLVFSKEPPYFVYSEVKAGYLDARDNDYWKDIPQGRAEWAKKYEEDASTYVDRIFDDIVDYTVPEFDDDELRFDE